MSPAKSISEPMLALFNTSCPVIEIAGRIASAELNFCSIAKVFYTVFVRVVIYFKVRYIATEHGHYQAIKSRAQKADRQKSRKVLPSQNSEGKWLSQGALRKLRKIFLDNVIRH